jgi:hypothetical protein
MFLGSPPNTSAAYAHSAPHRPLEEADLYLGMVFAYRQPAFFSLIWINQSKQSKQPVYWDSSDQEIKSRLAGLDLWGTAGGARCNL